jgi:peptide/nickel transport system substrate-binding protein
MRTSWRRCTIALVAQIPLLLTACRAPAPDPGTLTFLIESSPNNLDLRQGTDAQSERIGALIYDPLVRKDEHFNLRPWLATSWERPSPLTWVFHLRRGVHFHDGLPLTSADVAYSIRSMIDGTLTTAKSGGFTSIRSINTPDDATVIVETRTPDNSLLFNLSDGLFGVVERGANRDEGLHPVGSGPFRFVDAVQDKEVVLARNASYWAGPPSIQQVRFQVSPDNITTALELRKAARTRTPMVESNALPMDMVHALEQMPGLVVEGGPGARVDYLNFNVSDPRLRDPRVRHAIACSIDRAAIIASLWRGHAQLASTLLPTSHWAAAPASMLSVDAYDPARARALLEAAGLHPNAAGVRLRLTLKTSTDETTRLEAQAIQAQLQTVGIALELRPAEFGTFYADITHGAFQLYMLRWIGSNEDPDIYHYAYASSMQPPKGANRGHYVNPQLDALLDDAETATNRAQRQNDLLRVQQTLADDLPTLPLWYPDNIVVHTDELTGVTSTAGGSFDFLRTARLAQ